MNLEQIDEINILQNARLVSKISTSTTASKENLQVIFQLIGDLKGQIQCFLCLDNLELNTAEKNYLFPLFTESMNILIGKQISQDKRYGKLKIKLSPPKISMIPQEISVEAQVNMQRYELVLDMIVFKVLVIHSLELIN